MPQLRWNVRLTKKKNLEIVTYANQAQIILKTGENLNLGDRVANSEASLRNMSISKPRRMKTL